jgi:signal transduction histidine kinase
LDAASMPGHAAEDLVGPEPFAAAIGGAAEVEVEAIRHGGSRFPAQVAVSPLRDVGGIGAAVLVVSDLTARKLLDMQLMHSARLATLGEMAASIAHEFNQCLHVIRLAAESIEMDAAGDSSLARRSANILSQVDRLTEMVVQMRSTSRRDRAEKRSFLLADALEAAARMVAHSFRVEGIRLVRAWPSNMDFAVHGHRVRLEQVLINLLNNARDAIRDRMTREGDAEGGTVVLDACWRQADQRMEVTVRDDGIGVPAELADQIFDAFVTTKSEEDGCGLGLSICRGIARELGGELTFRSLPRGTEFVVELPAAPRTDQAAADAPREEAPPAAVPASAGGRRVLVVDDEALSAMIAAEFLEHQGYKVDTAHDGEQALARCHATVYDAVVTDIRMPRMDGFEFIRRLADLQPGTPVVVITGHLRHDEIRIEPPVAAVLEKPFQMTDLLGRLADLDHGRDAIALGD